MQHQPSSAGHINTEAQIAVNTDIPTPVAATPLLPRPRAAAKTESYSVSVRNIPVQDLLFALARDAKLNVDVHPGINGIVTINAIDQTLQQILTRISRQVDMRWELDGPNLLVMPDTPFLRNYKVDYVNMSRELTGSVSINTQIASTSTSAAGGSSGSGNNSATSVKSSAQNNFWLSIEKNLKDILRESDKILPEGSSETVIERSDQQATTGTGAQSSQTAGRSSAQAGGISGSPNPATVQQQGTTVVKRTTFREAASIIVNPEAGVIVVRASARQHEKVQEYLDLVLINARRQVVIEATIAEVSLNDAYQQGINWQSLRSLRPGNPQAGFSLAQNPTTATNPVLTTSGSFVTSTTAPTFGASPGTFAFLLNYVAPGLGLVSTLSLLETFGKVKVLSSPKLSVLNNQTAMLKVVNNLVYFEVKNDSTTTTTGTTNNFTATAKSISVGLVMSVTPQISENGSILLNVRPTISSKTGDVQDPTPNLGAVNNVPVIQTREMESMLRLSDGEVAVMGGLMEDKISNTSSQVPGLGDLPGVGNFFRNRSDTMSKTELVIFLKPTIIRDPSITTDYQSFRDLLPSRTYFKDPATKAATQPAQAGAGPQ
ncbi:MAG: pilus (MSHA type) biogenesis protein MshL [Rhodocyclales bacterium]|nr:pilus (MSHA type) biogenesis protein MshL [Rhodocyclales bacterium]